MWKARFLFDEISAAGETMSEGKTPHFERSVLEDKGMNGCIYDFEVNLVS